MAVCVPGMPGLTRLLRNSNFRGFTATGDKESELGLSQRATEQESRGGRMGVSTEEGPWLYNAVLKKLR